MSPSPPPSHPPPPPRSAGDAGPLSERVAAAGRALADGGLVLMPTETVYGVAWLGTSGVATARARALAMSRTGQTPRPLAWHASTTEALVRVLRLSAPLHLRLVDRLMPGPVVVRRRLSEPEAAGARRDLGVEAGMIDAEGEFYARVPGSETARAVLSAAGAAVVLERASTFAFGDGSALAPAAAAAAAGLGVHVLDLGPAPLGRPSTPIELTEAGYRVAGPGALAADVIHRRLERLVLFVCTGNTCRSPMAEAIAQHEIERTPPLIPTRVASAGVHAMPGDAMTPEAARALEAMGVPAGSHRSRGLSTDLVQRAEVIYAMTGEHARAIARAAPAARDRIQVLDPGGRDVPDPIGGPADLYARTARDLRGMIGARLAELRAADADSGPPPASSPASSSPPAAAPDRGRPSENAP